MVSSSCKKRFGKIMLEKMNIVHQEEIAPRIFAMDLQGEMVSQMKAGQFLHIRVPDDTKLLRRPISISEIDKERKICRIIYRIEGAGTEIFSKLQKDFQLDVMGPQGNGFDLKELHSKGVKVTSVLGFATKAAVILEEEMKKYGRVIVTTDDGSYGRKGYVSSVVNELPESFTAVYACGAPGMLRYVDETFRSHPRAYISMESRMACGMGACYACVLHVAGEDQSVNKRVCEDGPVFETGTVLV